MEDQLERRVLVLPGSTLVGPWTVCSFPCARRHEQRQVLLSRGAVAELHRIQRPLGSWFVDESVEGSQLRGAKAFVCGLSERPA